MTDWSGVGIKKRSTSLLQGCLVSALTSIPQSIKTAAAPELHLSNGKGCYHWTRAHSLSGRQFQPSLESTPTSTAPTSTEY